MKKTHLILVILILLSVLLSSCQNAPKPSETVPSGGTTVSTDGEQTDPATKPTELTEPSVPADKFLLELKELSLKIVLPISWKDRMEIVEDDATVFLLPPPEDYNVPRDHAFIHLAYMDNPDLYGHTFEEVTREETLNNMFIVSENDKIIEKNPMKMMGRNALAVTYSMVWDNRTQVNRAFLIDAEKGRFYFIKYMVEAEGLDGIVTFASEAEEAVESLSYYQTDPAIITYEEKEKGFALEVPGDWIINKIGERVWKFRPPVGTYEFPYPKAEMSIRYYSPGDEGKSFEEVTSPEVLKSFYPEPILKREPGKIGAADTMTVLWERLIATAKININKTFEYWAILIDAGEGGFYYCEYHCEKGNDDYVPFREAVEQIIQSFRMTKP
jgi:hypothetical protein